jgi:hypothetical protein
MSRDGDAQQRLWLSFGYGGKQAPVTTWRYWAKPNETREWFILAPNDLAEFEQKHTAVYYKGEQILKEETQWLATWATLAYFYKEIVPKLKPPPKSAEEYRGHSPRVIDTEPCEDAAIADFENQLTEFIGKPTDLRPFVCDGSPLECEVFIVGINPATAMSADFWQFWRSGYGFDKAAWFQTYKEDRKTQPLKEGKTRRNEVSNTRRVIEWILEEATPVRCLETNIYSVPTEAAADLSSQKQVTAPLDFLLEKIKPRIIVAHGKDAVSYIQRKHLAARVIEVPHFARGWKEADARALGRQIKSEVHCRQDI